jgi:hypothetical protein
MKTSLLLLLLPLCSISLEAARPGEQAQSWEMVGLDGRTYRLPEEAGKVVVLEWINYGCPFVRKHYDGGNMQKLQADWTGKGVLWYSVRSGDLNAHEKEGVRAKAKQNGSKATAVLLDPDGKVATAYNARATPHVFIINAKGILAYSGALDDQPTPDPASLEGARNYVAEALGAVLAGKPVEVAAKRPYGCGVQ